MHDQVTRKSYLAEKKYDHRTTAWRPDIAAKEFEGLLPSESYEEGTRYQCAVADTALRFEPRGTANVETHLLFGETMIVYEIKDGFAWGKTGHDSHTGFVSASALTKEIREPTHWVSVPCTPVYPRPDRQAEPRMFLALNARVKEEKEKAEDDIFVSIGKDQWIFRKDIREIGDWFTDPITPVLPFANTSPYVWGSRNGVSYDCSGLTQAGWMAMGIRAPRDADQQENDETLGSSVSFNSDLSDLGTYDQVYWPGHLATMVDETRAIHAKGSEERRVVVQPIKEICAWRLEEFGQAIRTVKRRQ